ncbi:MAG: Flp pilus assembly protein CpaB [Sphingomonadales bacterium]|nr:Flp pilus assembly protein CpaB [Sphingomonadales bacterium]
MDGKKLFLIIGALVVAIGAAFGVNTLMRGSATPQSQAAAAAVPQGPDILVATRALPVGTIITPDAVRYQAWPQALVDDKNYFLREKTANGSLVGTVVRNAITAGEPLTQGALVHPGERGFLAAALGPGMRAVTVSVSAQTAVAGFVFPGDRVDLSLTQSITGDDDQALYVTDTIVRNLRVLATDQRTTSKNADGKDEVLTYALVTLEVTPRIAEKITVAQVMGKLSLVLRPLAEDTAELERAIAAGEVKVPEDAEGEKRLLLEIKSRPSDSDVTSTTGGEVSPWARRSKPSTGGNGGGSGARADVQQGPVYSDRAGSAAPAAPVYSGPSVRVVRGDQVSVVPVGGK